MARLGMVGPDFRRTRRDVFSVDRALFDYCCVSDVGRESVGESKFDVSPLPPSL